MRYKKTTIILVSLAVLGIYLVAVIRKQAQQPSTQKLLPSVVSIVSSTIPTQASSTAEVKIYRNEEFGFEFQYPKNWKLEENSFYSPFSKFNLEGDSSAKNYNPENPAFIVNVVTPDFVERQFASLKSVAQKISVGGVEGKKYEYTEQFTEIAVSLPLGKHQVILGTRKEYESIFNKILASFKFLK